MRRPATALLAVTAAALLALTGCSADDDADAKPTQAATTADTGKSSDAEKSAGIPDAPTGAERDAYLAAIKAAAPTAVEDEEKAIDAGRNQCSSLNGGGADPDGAAAQRFGNDAAPLTVEQGKALNAALRATLCPE
ncbi:DUF732 domain-containing protein [Streptomyces salyersiae]|uniref:DUF732 domain-containing protein n=1 Tax=Streptomyces salyersiae TaxID=3075530 RepID=A0ABU2RVD1_9ACTN|nr:DUF732 domain-containing protein [Streptomyces sp. DSM 41770]MDT0432792.1 DUF732 domain-containing protein [Streptomyces sp. DSM 41770]